MAWRLSQSVVRGVIDNRVRNRVDGQLWVTGREEPITLTLTGNCLRDIAGCLLTFGNPSPVRGDKVDLSGIQDGSVGDITASRRVRLLDVPMDEALKMMDAGQPVPEHIGNALYLEWFSHSNGRVVIEGGDFVFRVSEPAWVMSEAEEKEQVKANRKALRHWLPKAGGGGEEVPPMDEFEWERSLKESDRLTERYSELLDKYMNHPDRDRIVAREMGWSWMEAALEAAMKEQREQRARAADSSRESSGDDPTDVDDLDMEPDPLTEGVNWIRTRDGDISHPLVVRASEAAIRMRRLCDEHGLMKDGGDGDVRDMVLHAQTLGTKLAGALNVLAYEGAIEGGFVVACLKRALKYFDRAQEALIKVRPKRLLDETCLDTFHQELFAIREEMLRLMKEHRRRIG